MEERICIAISNMAFALFVFACMHVFQAWLEYVSRCAKSSDIYIMTKSLPDTGDLSDWSASHITHFLPL